MIGERLVEGADDAVENAADRRDHLELLVHGAVAGGDLPRQAALIEIAADIAAEAHAEGAHRLGADAGSSSPPRRRNRRRR